MRHQVAAQCLCFRRDLSKLERSGMLGTFGDGFAKFCLRRFTKTRQLGDAP